MSIFRNNKLRKPKKIKTNLKANWIHERKEKLGQMLQPNRIINA